METRLKSKSIDKGDCFNSVSLFTEYISNRIYYSGRGYTEMKINNHKFSSVLTKATFRCQITLRNFSILISLGTAIF